MGSPLGSPRGLMVPDSSWKHVGSICVPLPGSLVYHSDDIQGSKYVVLVAKEDVCTVRCLDTGYADFSCAW